MFGAMAPHHSFRWSAITKAGWSSTPWRSKSHVRKPKNFRYLTMAGFFLYLIRFIRFYNAILGGVCFPLTWAVDTYTFYRWVFLHFRYLKCLVMRSFQLKKPCWCRCWWPGPKKQVGKQLQAWHVKLRFCLEMPQVLFLGNLPTWHYKIIDL